MFVPIRGYWGHRVRIVSCSALSALATVLVTVPTFAADPGVWSAAGDTVVLHSTSHPGSPPGGATVTLLNDGRALLAGGEDTYVLADAELFDPMTGTWSATTSMLSDRRNYTATLLADGRVLAAGGRSEYDPAINTAEVFDPSTQKWTQTASMHDFRTDHTATRLPSGQVLVTGGWLAGTDCASPTTELYDPRAGTWTSAAPMNVPRQQHAASLLQDGRVLIVGAPSCPGPGAPTAELYDPIKGTWSLTGSMNAARFIRAATGLLDGRVVVFGPSGPFTTSESGELYSPATGTWALTARPPAGFVVWSAVRLADGRVLTVGLSDNLPKSAIYDPGTDTWSGVTNMLGIDSETVWVLLADGRALALSGQGQTQLYAGPAPASISSATLRPTTRQTATAPTPAIPRRIRKP